MAETPETPENPPNPEGKKPEGVPPLSKQTGSLPRAPLSIVYGSWKLAEVMGAGGTLDMNRCKYQ